MFGDSKRRRAAVVLALVAFWGWTAQAGAERAQPPRVPNNFYGVNFSPTPSMSYADQERHFQRMRAEGVRQVRVEVPWNEIEPNPPVNGKHDYKWQRTDPVIEAVARSGLRPSVTIALTPRWAQTNDPLERLQCTEPYVRTRRPVDIASYAKAAGAVAGRYGRGGTFWEGTSFRARPILRYFIWNEPNIYPTWCPRPDPVAYAHLFGSAYGEIKARDPQARVVVGSMPLTNAYSPPAFLMPGDFLAGMMYAQPDLPNMTDAIAVNTFWLDPYEQAMERVAIFREELRRGGVPDSEPMLISEAGWNTRGPGAFTEEERVRRMRIFSRQLPRSNCNVPGMNAHTWVSREQDPSTSEDWFGLVNPLTTDLFPAGQSYVESIALLRGRVDKRVARKTIYTCDGMPPPDRDRDGVIDEDDRYPLRADKA